MIVTIDGPAGAGKSTVAKALARRLGFRFLDTGAMYRAVALAAMRRGLDWDRPEELVALARQLRIELLKDRVLLDGEDVSEAIRSQEVTAVSRHAADNPRVREHLVRLQRALAEKHDVVTEGRDQGTVAFADAQCKIFLTAGAEERARRRLADLEARGESATLQKVFEAQETRDRRDAGREVGPLAQAGDAVEVRTDGMTVEQVVDRLVRLVRQKQSEVKHPS
jgi:cytidylate kinase